MLLDVPVADEGSEPSGCLNDVIIWRKLAPIYRDTLGCNGDVPSTRPSPDGQLLWRYHLSFTR